jgi:hypothetical protein
MSYYTLLTTVGAARLANAQATETPVALTEIAVGDGEDNAAYDPVEAQTELKNEQWRGDINQIYVHAENPNWIVIEGVVPEEDGGWFVREVGVFDDDGNMIAIGKYPDSYKPALAEGSAKDLYIRMILQISNTGTVELQIDPAIVLATRTYADGKVEDHEAAADPHSQYTVPAATAAVQGKVELATVAEATAGTDEDRAVTPAGLSAGLAAQRKNDLLNRLLDEMAEATANRALNAKPDGFDNLDGIDEGNSSNYIHDEDRKTIGNPAVQVTPSSSGIWEGNAGAVYSGDDVALAHDTHRSIRTVETFSGDVAIEWDWTAGGAETYLGFYQSASDGSFNSNSSLSVLPAAAVSYVVYYSGQIAFHDPSIGSHGPWPGGVEGATTMSMAGTRCRLERVSNAVKFYVDDVLIHTFTSDLTGDIRVAIGNGNAGTGTDFDDIALEIPGVAGALDVRTVSYEADAVPETGYAVMLFEQIDEATYDDGSGGDVTLWLSRNDGGDWEKAPAELLGTVEVPVPGGMIAADAVYAEKAFATGAGDQTVRLRWTHADGVHVEAHGLIIDAEG